VLSPLPADAVGGEGVADDGPVPVGGNGDPQGAQNHGGSIADVHRGTEGVTALDAGAGADPGNGHVAAVFRAVNLAMPTVVSGDDGVRVLGIESQSHGAHRQVKKVLADLDLNGLPDTGDEEMSVGGGPSLGRGRQYRGGLFLYPGMHLTARKKPDKGRGAVRAAPSSRSYRFFLPGNPDLVTVYLENLVTGATVSSSVGMSRGGDDVLRPLVPSGAAVLTAGYESTHPWTLPVPGAVWTLARLGTDVVLGPGKVTIRSTRVYPAGSTLTIAPGTRLILKKGASLVVRGRLADSSGTIGFISWRAFDNEVGSLIKIDRASIRRYRDTPEINISDSTKIEPYIDKSFASVEELNTSTRSKIADLRDGMRDVEITVQVENWQARTFTNADGEERRAFFGFKLPCRSLLRSSAAGNVKNCV